MFRQEKMTEQIHHLASEFVEKESNHQSLITVTRVILSDDSKEAKILVTILPESKEKMAIDFLKRKRSDFKKYFKDKGTIGRIPFFDFEIDLGQKNANLIDSLSKSNKLR